MSSDEKGGSLSSQEGQEDEVAMEEAREVTVIPVVDNPSEISENHCPVAVGIGIPDSGLATERDNQIESSNEGLEYTDSWAPNVANASQPDHPRTNTTEQETGGPDAVIRARREGESGPQSSQEGLEDEAAIEEAQEVTALRDNPNEIDEHHRPVAVGIGIPESGLATERDNQIESLNEGNENTDNQEHAVANASQTNLYRTNNTEQQTGATDSVTKVTRDAALTLALHESFGVHWEKSPRITGQDHAIEDQSDPTEAQDDVAIPMIPMMGNEGEPGVDRTATRTTTNGHQRPGAEWVVGIDGDVGENSTSSSSASYTRTNTIVSATLVDSTYVDEQVKERIRQELLANAVQAQVEHTSNINIGAVDQQPGRFGRRAMILYSGLSLLVVIALIATIVGFLVSRDEGQSVSLCDKWTLSGSPILMTHASTQYFTWATAIDAGKFILPDACHIQTGGRLMVVKTLGTGSPLTVSTCKEATNFPARLEVLEGACTDAQCKEAVNNTLCPGRMHSDKVTFDSVYGQEYFFVVSGFTSNDDVVGMSIRAKHDTCETAQGPIIPDTNFVHRSVIDSNSKWCNQSCWYGAGQLFGPGAWYKLLATGATITATVSCDPASVADLMLTNFTGLSLTVLEGGCDSSACVDAAIRPCQFDTAVSFKSRPDQEYWLLVRARSSKRALAEGVRFNLSVASAGGQTNDRCGTAQPIPFVGGEDNRSKPYFVQGSTIEADSYSSTDVKLPQCGEIPNNHESGGVWFSVQGTGKGIRASTCHTWWLPAEGRLPFVPLEISARVFTTRVSVYEGYCQGSADEGGLRCVENTHVEFCEVLPHSLGKVTWQSKENSTYYIYVQSLFQEDERFNYTATEGHFVLSLEDAPLPPTLCDIEVDLKCISGCQYGEVPSCQEQPKQIEFTNVGGKCGNYNNQPQYYCEDFGEGPPALNTSEGFGHLLVSYFTDGHAANASFIVVTNRLNKGDIYFQDWVELGGDMLLYGKGDEIEFSRYLNFSLYSSNETSADALMQVVTFDTDCDFGLDDSRHGSIKLSSFTNTKQGEVVLQSGAPDLNIFYTVWDAAVQAPLGSHGLIMKHWDFELILGGFGFVRYPWDEPTNTSLIPGYRPKKWTINSFTDFLHPSIITMFGKPRVDSDETCQLQVLSML
ncbi:expressed unknown protein [Seminavis robusta]|uniref:DUF7467 domain-containing protein n=1 Tax=Seminavis robusta TaxID=568900 RepID=A0A9N8H6X8_9STRA|nr:expressed unknown protein [Seminavis robusta]|eukprot:Sro161_g072410.1 n/a (1149) ;mRNA; r:23888-27411